MTQEETPTIIGERVVALREVIAGHLFRMPCSQLKVENPETRQFFLKEVDFIFAILIEAGLGWPGEILTPDEIHEAVMVENGKILQEHNEPSDDEKFNRQRRAIVQAQQDQFILLKMPEVKK